MSIAALFRELRAEKSVAGAIKGQLARGGMDLRRAPSWLVHIRGGGNTATSDAARADLREVQLAMKQDLTRLVVECPCGQKNKVNALKTGARCGRCKSDLRIPTLAALKKAADDPHGIGDFMNMFRGRR